MNLPSYWSLPPWQLTTSRIATSSCSMSFGTAGNRRPRTPASHRRTQATPNRRISSRDHRTRKEEKNSFILLVFGRTVNCNVQQLRKEHNRLRDHMCSVHERERGLVHQTSNPRKSSIDNVRACRGRRCEGRRRKDGSGSKSVSSSSPKNASCSARCWTVSSLNSICWLC